MGMGVTPRGWGTRKGWVETPWGAAGCSGRINPPLSMLVSWAGNWDELGGAGEGGGKAGRKVLTWGWEVAEEEEEEELRLGWRIAAAWAELQLEGPLLGGGGAGGAGRGGGADWGHPSQLPLPGPWRPLGWTDPAPEPPNPTELGTPSFGDLPPPSPGTQHLAGTGGAHGWGWGGGGWGSPWAVGPQSTGVSAPPRGHSPHPHTVCPASIRLSVRPAIHPPNPSTSCPYGWRTPAPDLSRITPDKINHQSTPPTAHPQPNHPATSTPTQIPQP